MIGGFDAQKKGLAVGESIIAKTRKMFKTLSMQDYHRYNLETLGAESLYGPHLGRAQHVREVVLRITATHNEKKALELLAKEIPPAALAMAPGITGGASGRPQPTPFVLYHSCLIKKKEVPVSIIVGSEDTISLIDVNESTHKPPSRTLLPKVSGASVSEPYNEPTVTIPLMSLCHGRSGDKGDVANIGLICRHTKFFSLVDTQVTAQKVKAYMAHLVKGSVTRYTLEGVHAFNFVCTTALDGGGLSSLAMDRQGKCYAQVLLDMPVCVPVSLWRQAKF